MNGNSQGCKCLEMLTHVSLNFSPFADEKGIFQVQSTSAEGTSDRQQPRVKRTRNTRASGCPAQAGAPFTGHISTEGTFALERGGWGGCMTKGSPSHTNTLLPLRQNILENIFCSTYFLNLRTDSSVFKCLFHAEGFKVMLLLALPSTQCRKRSLTN